MAYVVLKHQMKLESKELMFLPAAKPCRSISGAIHHVQPDSSEIE